MHKNAYRQRANIRTTFTTQKTIDKHSERGSPHSILRQIAVDRRNTPFLFPSKIHCVLPHRKNAIYSLSVGIGSDVPGPSLTASSSAPSSLSMRAFSLSVDPFPLFSDNLSATESLSFSLSSSPISASAASLQSIDSFA